jgi:DNA-binding CsgD family transcriptional regulator
MNFASQLAEMALASESAQSFHQQFVESASRVIGAIGGSYIAGRVLGRGDTASTLDTPRSFATAAADFVKQANELEVARAISSGASRCDAIFSNKRLDSIRFFREYLSRIGAEKNVMRIWLARDSIHLFVFTPGKLVNFDRFAARSIPLLDEVFPILGLAERLLAQSEMVNEAQSLSRDLTRELRLTDAEHEAMALVMRGLTNREVAQVCSVSTNTVRNQLASCFRKIGASTRTEAMFILNAARRERYFNDQDALSAYREVTRKLCEQRSAASHDRPRPK